MDTSQIAYVVLLLVVGGGRLVELSISAQNQRLMSARGIAKVPERHFHLMVLLNVGVLFSAGFETLYFHRPFYPLLAISAGLIFLLANFLRWWVISTLSGRWNVQIMASAELGVVTGGPYRWIRHPNYVAVFIELLALPLVHTAWLTALWASVANFWALSRRIGTEEKLLFADRVYRSEMGTKPRFIPQIFPPKQKVIQIRERTE